MVNDLRFERERKELGDYLEDKKLDINGLMAIMGKNFNTFIEGLSRYSDFIAQAAQTTEQTKDINQVSYLMAAEAREQQEILGEMIINTFGIDLIQGGYGEALADYITEIDREGVRKCEKALGIYSSGIIIK
jgi:hypothetical protein